jgi:hypothetical protein
MRKRRCAREQCKTVNSASKAPSHRAAF